MELRQLRDLGALICLVTYQGEYTMIELKKVIEKYPFCIDSSNTLKSVLSDTYPDEKNKSKIYIISVILESGLIKRIQKSESVDDDELHKYSSILEKKYGFKSELCIECLKIWAIALNKYNARRVIDNNDKRLNDNKVLRKLSLENEEFIIKDGCLVEYIGDYKDPMKRHQRYPSKKWVVFVNVPDGVVAIGSYAFRGSQIKQVALPSSCTIIEDYAFINSSLSEIKLSNNIKTIGNGAFQDCKNLRELRLPSKIEVIYKETFSGCTSLEKVVLNNQLKRIGKEAFYDCESLLSMEMPLSIERIAQDAFLGNDDMIIMGKKKSYAERYANTEGFEFESI